MKFNYLFAFAVLTMLSFVGKANAQDRRNYLSVAYGYSLPVGEFARLSPDDPLAGLAGDGFYGQFNYDRKLSNWFGFRISGSYNNNTTNANPIVKLANSYAGATGKTYTWQTDVSEWQMAAALIGPAIFLHISKLQIEGHVQGGIIKAQTPSVHMVGQALTPSGEIDASSRTIDIRLDNRTVTPWGFAGGLGLRLPLYRGLFIHATADVIGAQAEVKDLAFKAKIGELELSEQISEKRFIGVVNIGGGLGIAF